MRAAVCREPEKDLSVEEVDLPEISEEEVLIRVHCCGVCHSDVHIVDGDWKEWVSYPTIPGHEVAGTVVKTGGKVKSVKEGDRVGVPWIHSSCEVCDYCVEGDEPLCPEHRITGISVQGGYAEYIKVPERFATKIPDELDPLHAAPLFCAGVTVYAALRHVGVKPGELVAVQGLGGLGHLAVQYAKAMGARVAVLSHSPDKEKAAESLGADIFIDTSGSTGVEELKRAGGADVVLSTVFRSDLIQPLVSALSPRGRLTVVGAAPDPIQINPIDLIVRRLVITGSAVGGRKLLRETLRMAAEFGIKPVIEVFPLEEVNTALQRVREGSVRFRAVLKMV